MNRERTKKPSPLHRSLPKKSPEIKFTPAVRCRLLEPDYARSLANHVCHTEGRYFPIMQEGAENSEEERTKSQKMEKNNRGDAIKFESKH